MNIVKGEITDNVYDQFNYILVNNIKVYTGTTQYSNVSLTKKIKACNKEVSMLSELAPSTLTAKGKLSGISFKEDEIIDMLTTPVGGYILKIGCNYGVLKNPSPDYIYPAERVRTSKRGRKPKNKSKSKRKLQGTGDFFSSQITFSIYNVDNGKIYKIKLFRNGRFQVPGVNKPDMSDLAMPIKILRDYLREEFLDDKIEIEYFISVMRNYICNIKNKNFLIRLNSLETTLKTIKETNENNDLIDLLCDKYVVSGCDIIKSYLNRSSIDIAEIQNNCERYFGLIIKFYRPVPWRIDKRTTVKILRSGKINIDGGNSIEECYELYYWLDHMFSKYQADILYNTVEAVANNSDDMSGESIYDDDL
jgi:TATA-box binding protein (TBP) (component of TFIID and TFIIIB)